MPASDADVTDKEKRRLPVGTINEKKKTNTHQ
jgi:hypothetical protein